MWQDKSLQNYSLNMHKLWVILIDNILDCRNFFCRFCLFVYSFAWAINKFYLFNKSIFQKCP